MVWDRTPRPVPVAMDPPRPVDAVVIGSGYTGPSAALVSAAPWRDGVREACGKGFHIETARGAVAARNVVVATNGYTAS